MFRSVEGAMTAFATPIAKHRSWRALLFRAVAGLAAALLLATEGAGVLVPWFDLSSFGARRYAATMDGWHAAQWGALVGIIVAGSLLMLSLWPRAQPLLLQFLVLAAALPAAVGMRFDPFLLLIFVVPVALCVVAYPKPRDLLARSPGLRWSAPLLALSLLTAALLAPGIWAQIGGADPVGQGVGWTYDAVLAVAVVLGGALAATKRPGWLALALLIGATLIYLGLAAVVLADQRGGWGATGGALATIGGWAFVGAAWWEARRPA